jgi:hypothetical protein
MKSSLLVTSIALGQVAFALWPIPSSYTLGSSTLWISRDVKVELSTAGASNVGTMNLIEQEILT